MTVLHTLDRFLDRLYGWCGYVSAGLLVLLAGLVTTSIVSRLFSVFIPGITEYSGYTMAAASFLAFAYTFRENGHIRVAILLGALHGRRRWALQLWCLAAATIIAGYFAYYIVKMAHVSWKLGDRSEGADATLLWIPQAVTAFGAAILAICIAHHLIRFVFATEPAAADSEIEAPPEP
ncbi:MAG: TRAP transporter small permease [Alphaproteobacteria bacterium]|nr:TRAP transporter small permease [Alphaproteobacteria bacterium]